MSPHQTAQHPTTECPRPQSPETGRPGFLHPGTEHLTDFIPAAHIEELLKRPAPEAAQIRGIIAKSKRMERLDLEEMAALLATDDPDLQEEIFAAARELKKNVYGNRIVLFAPLYIGNKCINSCTYCGFRRDNRDIVRRTLTDDELRAEVRALIAKGHKRLVIDYGEHPDYGAETIAHAVDVIYSVKDGGEIRRINVNCAPLDVEGYRLMKVAGIGTYQIFQETYHRPTYARIHQRGPKSDFLWRLYGQDRAMEAGCDDVGLGVLFGLYDWRFEALALLAHAIHLEETFGVGPHTFSFPRLKDASNRALQPEYALGDADFKRLIAILRLSVPYVGMILTARETAELRRELIDFGCSQIDGGTRIEIGGYSEGDGEQDLDKEQFRIGDDRSLEAVVGELLEMGEIPSFCTACYRLGRTGEDFMDLAKPGEIKQHCDPNGLSTFLEYLIDYASPETRAVGERTIADALAGMDAWPRERAVQLMAKVEAGQRDVYC
jgi:2-iminoacetate synthase